MSLKTRDDPPHPNSRAPRCPQCRETLKGRGEAYPFCSARCQLLDLGAWATERYRVASESSDLTKSLDDREGLDSHATVTKLSKDTEDLPE